MHDIERVQIVAVGVILIASGSLYRMLYPLSSGWQVQCELRVK